MKTKITMALLLTLFIGFSHASDNLRGSSSSPISDLLENDAFGGDSSEKITAVIVSQKSSTRDRIEKMFKTRAAGLMNHIRKVEVYDDFSSVPEKYNSDNKCRVFVVDFKHYTKICADDYILHRNRRNNKSGLYLFDVEFMFVHVGNDYPNIDLPFLQPLK